MGCFLVMVLGNKEQHLSLDLYGPCVPVASHFRSHTRAIMSS